MGLEQSMIHPAAAAQPNRAPFYFNVNFLFLWLASSLTSLAFSIYLTTEAWYVVQGLRAPGLLGIVMAATTIPRVLLMAIGGVMADRKRRSRILLLVNTSRSFAIACMVVLLVNGALALPQLLAAALLFGVLDAFFWPSSSSLVPKVIDREHLTRANALLMTSQQFMLMFGPAAAGFMMKLGSFEASFTAAAVLLLAGGLLAARIKEPLLHAGIDTPASISGRPSATLLQELKEGLRYVWGFPFLLTIMSISVVVNLFLTGPLNAGLPVLVQEALQGDVLDLSILESSLAAGMLIGAGITGICNFRRKRAVLSLALIGGLGLSNAALSQIDSLWQGMLAAGITGLCLAISNIVGPSLLQELVEPGKLGRVQSLMATAGMGLTPVSYTLMALLLSSGVQVAFIMLCSSAIITLFAGAVLWRVKIIWRID